MRLLISGVAGAFVSFTFRDRFNQLSLGIDNQSYLYNTRMYMYVITLPIHTLPHPTTSTAEREDLAQTCKMNIGLLVYKSFTWRVLQWKKI